MEQVNVYDSQKKPEYVLQVTEQHGRRHCWILLYKSRKTSPQMAASTIDDSDRRRKRSVDGKDRAAIASKDDKDA
ncbi:hypothetical protein BDB00DRAFT_849112 [Zychaea mexicana]|uniref:uncharacterized protein n=1 Tax=Zychaea mexicana TaxID=64656 RepID=UPI0022FE1033|nr:uncharacterized protein BDB00DRAFT_849112 [Zychaea mexicana]KAI9488299.1 hypothetical protein BDB00DRAFT_849112 [Zychaea mexicana]